MGVNRYRKYRVQLNASLAPYPKRRVPVSMLPVLAHTLGMSLEELIGEPPTPAARKRGPAPALQRHMERISALPKAQQKFVLQVLDSVLQQAR